MIFDDDVDLNVIAASDPTKTLEDELPDEEPTVAEVNVFILRYCDASSSGRSWQTTGFPPSGKNLENGKSIFQTWKNQGI